MSRRFSLGYAALFFVVSTTIFKTPISAVNLRYLLYITTFVKLWVTRIVPDKAADRGKAHFPQRGQG